MEIITRRLRLRDLREDDLTAFHEMVGDAEFQRYEGQALSLEESREKLQKAIAANQAQPRNDYRLAITVPPDDRLVGVIHLTENWPITREWEIGWGVRRGCWGMGYAPEAALAVLRFGFNELKVHRVLALCHAGNTASTRVMEKIGMQREGRIRQTRLLNGQFFDEFVYGILEGELG